MENKKKPYDELLKLLKTGKENGVSRSHIAETLCITVRDVSALVLMARRDGLIIASGVTGYYYPADLEECHKYYDHERRRAITVLDSLKSVRKKLKDAGYLKKNGGANESN